MIWSGKKIVLKVCEDGMAMQEAMAKAFGRSDFKLTIK